MYVSHEGHGHLEGVPQPQVLGSKPITMVINHVSKSSGQIRIIISPTYPEIMKNYTPPPRTPPPKIIRSYRNWQSFQKATFFGGAQQKPRVFACPEVMGMIQPKGILPHLQLFRSFIKVVAWRIIPVSKWLVTPIYKPFRPFIRGITPFRGLTNHGY